ncbi:hypothetical protein AQUCO_05100024v1 [Aquilegia coerulea]|uniref:Secreted protein n=1 Tax=Aquilegia coerulea TaxID=218851 RepID=A0A2G5CIU4_AQUCA|nr:hypothetical protein AQUCO_05100024v1 [Aquilegia coerulea]
MFSRSKSMNCLIKLLVMVNKGFVSSIPIDGNYMKYGSIFAFRISFSCKACGDMKSSKTSSVTLICRSRSSKSRAESPLCSTTCFGCSQFNININCLFI